MADIIFELNLPKSTNFGSKPNGFNILNVPDNLTAGLTDAQWWTNYNKPFLDAAIARGDDIILATSPTEKYLGAILSRTTFGKEFDYLVGNGYHFDALTKMMVR